ncbi:MAG: histidinol dehydrogenase [Bacteroidota bacterium]
MQLLQQLDRRDWTSVLQRPAKDLSQLQSPVKEIMQAVRDGGDAAVRDFTARFDGVEVDSLRVPQEQLAKAGQQLSSDLREAIQIAKANIEAFHRAQLTNPQPLETMPGVSCWRKQVGIDKVGLYIPGGTAPLFSSVLMLAIPAVIAGCQEIVLCSPPQKDGQIHPATLYAAHLCGLPQVYRIGGAQAIAAMTYGTESVPAVYKLFGPGNAYVTVAKQLAFLDGLAIDMPAGPSEVLVCADQGANPAFVAADLLSQAEHGSDSQVVLLTFDLAHSKAILQEIDRQLAALPRREMAAASLSNSVAIVVNSQEEAAELINHYAPEHLILSMTNARQFAESIRNAGSIFLGYYTPESVGDYASGTNHTLPTYGYARQYSGVSLDSFVKQITFQELTPAGLQSLGPAVATLAEAEGLAAHRSAVSLRLAALKVKP